MSYKTATADDLKAIAEKMLAPQLTTFRAKINELQFEVNRLQRETIELKKELSTVREDCRVLSVQLRSAVDRLTRAVNNV